MIEREYQLSPTQLEDITNKLLPFVEDDNVARFAIEQHLYNLNQQVGSHAVSTFVRRFMQSVEAKA